MGYNIFDVCNSLCSFPTHFPRVGLSVWNVSGMQRWASTLANRRMLDIDLISEPPATPPPPDVCIQSVGICVARGAGSSSWLPGVSGCHIFVPAPHAPSLEGRGQRLKVVSLPTSARMLFFSDQIIPPEPAKRPFFITSLYTKYTCITTKKDMFLYCSLR
jgi:hypothetical protein